MAVITTSTFNPLKARCNVRLQQGVPIVDADWNELDDIRKFQLRSYLKWFVGDGIPNDGAAFKIDPASPVAADDFIVRFGGTVPQGVTNFDLAMRHAGRAIVDGMNIIITADLNFKAQSLPAALGVPAIAAMPTAAGDIAVYLNVWERLLTAQEEPALVLSGIGTESCARMERRWCVRTRAGKVLPKSGDVDFITDHSYYLLAVINRPSLNAPIQLANIQDNRHVRLSLASVETRLAKLEQQLLVPKFLPSPNQFDPKFGTPGTKIKLLGSNLAIDGLVVKFGTVVASTSDVTSSQLFAIVPTGMPVAAVKIMIQTNGGSVVSDNSFNVLGQPATPAPKFNAAPNQFNPKLGGAGTSVSLFGTNFDAGPPAAVRFGNVAAPIVGSPTAGQINVNVPVMGTGPIKITVQTSGGTVLSDDTFTVT